jgi:hypothetical protein
LDQLIDFGCFSNISAISWRPVLVVDEVEYPERTTNPGQTTGKTLSLAGANPRRIGDRLV